MENALRLIIEPLIRWLPVIFPLFMGSALIAYFWLKEKGSSSHFLKSFSYQRLALIGAGYHILYAALWSFGIYFYWSYVARQSAEAAKFYRVLLGWNYFSEHIWLAYWLNAVLAIAMAFFFYLFLRLLGHRNERFFAEGEEELGLACSLAVGWPNFVLFLPLVFLSVVIISVARMLVWKQEYTRLGPPFLLAMALAMILGAWLIRETGLSILII